MAPWQGHFDPLRGANDAMPCRAWPTARNYTFIKLIRFDSYRATRQKKARTG